MGEETPHFDARLKEGVAYFEQMLKVMPDDRTTLEFLAVAYPQMGETEKSERVLAELARVLLKEGDLESAQALLPRLEACSEASAQTMAIRVRAAGAPRPELVPEAAPAQADNGFAAAVAAESALAEKLGEPETAEHIRALPDNGRAFLVSALSTLEKEKPDACERALAQLADECGDPPVPLDAFEPDRVLAKKLPTDLMRRRGVVPFARLGELALVVTLSPQDAELKRAVSEALETKVRWFLAEPRHVEAALEKLFPEDASVA